VHDAIQEGNAMKKVLMFTMQGCPYCRNAHRWMDELFLEHPEYKAVELEIVDEVKQRELAARYDYYYFPTYYVGGVKVHEGVPQKDTILKVFRQAYEG
jgi:glutaredoxin